jgi:hypothetical protein
MYINRYLTDVTPFGDDGIDTFDQLTPSHVEGHNLQKFMLASTFGWPTHPSKHPRDLGSQPNKKFNTKA